MEILWIVFNIATYAFAVMGFIASLGLLTDVVKRRFCNNTILSSEPEVEKLPHELYPELVYWKIGDEFRWSDTTCKYLGVKSNRIIGEVVTPGERTYTCGEKDNLKHYKGLIHRFGFENLDDRKLIENKSAINREIAIDAAKVKKELEEEPYNAFLAELAEVNRKFLAEEN